MGLPVWAVSDVINDYNLACQSYNQNDFSHAQKQLAGIVNSHPEFYPAFQKIANTFVQSHRSADGLEYFNHIIAKDTLNSLAWYGKAIILIKEKNYNQAIEYLTSSIRLNHQFPQVFYTLGECFARANRVSEGVDYFTSLLNTKCPKAYCYYGIGAIYYKKKDYTKAKKNFIKSTIADSTPGLAFKQLGSIYLRTTGDVIRARTNYEKWGKSLDGIGEDLRSYTYHIALCNLGNNDLVKARNNFKKSLALSKLYKSDAVNKNYLYLGKIDESLGRLFSAEQHYKSILATESHCSKFYINAMTYLADLYSKRGFYSSAIEQYLRAIEIADSCNGERAKYLAMLNMAAMYVSIGNLQSAVQYFNECEQYYTRTNNTYHLSNISINMGAIYDEQGKYDQALKYYKKALKISKKLGKMDGTINLLCSISEIQIRNKDFKTAGKNLQKASGLAHTQKENTYITEIYRLNGYLYQQSNQFTRALDYFHKAYSYELKLKRPYFFVPVMEGIAQTWNKINQPDSAVHYYKKAIAFFDSIRTKIGVEEIKRDFLNSRIRIYDNIIQTLIKTGKPESQQEAFLYAEKAKAQSLKALLNKSISLLEAQIPDSISIKLGNLSYNIENNLHQVLELKLHGKVSQDSITKIERKNLSLEIEKEKLLDRVQSFHSYKDQVLLFHPVSVKATQQKLNNDQILLEYKITENALTCFCVTKDSFHIFSQDISRDSLDMLVKNTIQKVNRKSISIQDLEFLSDLLIKPVVKYLAGKQIIIIPDQVLFHLPFEMLVLERKQARFKRDFKHCTFLIEQNPIVYYPAAALVNKTIPKQKEPELNFLAFGDPDVIPDPKKHTTIRLDYSKKEVLNVAQIFNKRKRRVFTDKNAGKNRFKNMSDNFKVEHFASHVIIDDIQPMYSHIVMKGDSTEDGNLYMYEIMNLRINADMCVLSGCNSALGRLYQGEGIVGFAQAFLAAGAQSLVMSLWSVEDKSTSELMIRFYQNLKQGMAKDIAIQQAKISLIHDDLSDPYFWAPFKLIGCTDAISFDSDKKYSYRILFSLIPLLLFLILFWGIKKHKIRN